MFGKGNDRTSGGDGFNNDSNFDTSGNEVSGQGRDTPDLGGYQRGQNIAGDGISGDMNFDLNRRELQNRTGGGTPDLGGYQRGRNVTGDGIDGDVNFDSDGEEDFRKNVFVPDLGGYEHLGRRGQGHGGFDEECSRNTGAGVHGGHGRRYSLGGTTKVEQAASTPSDNVEAQHKTTMGEKIKGTFDKITHKHHSEGQVASAKANNA